MISVMLADDEERVCRLIQALVDWQKFDMQIVGIAHNGVEALELAQETRPDIVITDIRMPGCSGLELIQHMRQLCTEAEFIIISGYTDFEYAKTAIQYGVSDYLRKPISKQELQETLEQLGQKIRKRVQMKSETDKLRRKLMIDQKKVRSCYLLDIVSHKCEAETLEQINREYYFSFRAGMFRGFAIKLDYDPDRFSAEEMSQMLGRVRQLGMSRMQDLCMELEICFENSIGYGILNYSRENKARIQERLAQYLRDLQVRSEVFPSIVFSLAMADEVQQEAELAASVLQARQLVDERFVFGSQKVLTNHMPGKSKPVHRFADTCYEQLSSAMKLGDTKEVACVLEQLQCEITSQQDLTGQDIVRTIMLIGDRLIEQLQGYSACETAAAEFHRRCMLCNTTEQLLECLKNLVEQNFSQLNAAGDLEEKRPIQIAKNYLETHYAESIRLEQVASMVGFNPTYFSALFKKECDIGFQEYLTELRIKKAMELLKKSDLSLSEICSRIGYNDVRHFTKTFKKVTRLSPGGYRKMYRN